MNSRQLQDQIDVDLEKSLIREAKKPAVEVQFEGLLSEKETVEVVSANGSVYLKKKNGVLIPIKRVSS